MAIHPLNQLREQLERFRSAALEEGREWVSSGVPELDAVLPQRGFARGTLVEWLAEGKGSGAGTLALATAAQACGEGRPLVVVDASGEFYPPAALLRGLTSERLIVVRVRSVADEAWALHQALGCPGVGAVLSWTDRRDSRVWRRWQLAAEQGTGLGLFLRPIDCRHEPCWAETRLLVTPLAGVGNRTVRIEVLRCRGMAGGQTVDVELEHEPSVMPATPLEVAPTRRRRSG